jgi:hypothetical protein
MSLTERAIEKVRQLSEEQAQRLLRWLDEAECVVLPPRTAPGAVAMLGFARRFYPEPRTTAQWLRELREGEE